MSDLLKSLWQNPENEKRMAALYGAAEVENQKKRYSGLLQGRSLFFLPPDVRKSAEIIRTITMAAFLRQRLIWIRWPWSRPAMTA